MVDDTIGYIKLSRFAANTYKELLSALSKLMEEGYDPADP